MAISRIQPQLLLLASLFFLPALYDSHKFEYCNNNAGYDFGKVTRVATTPTEDDPTTNTIYVSIDATQGLNGGDVAVLLRMVQGGGTMDGHLYVLRNVVEELPIKPTTSFILTLPKVAFESISAETRYNSVTVELYNDEYIGIGGHIPVLCINFNPWIDTESAAVSA